MREKVFEMFLDIIYVKMFHVSISPRVKHYHQSNDLTTTTHFRLSLGFIPQDMFLNRFIKFKAEIINKVENIGNFIIGKSHALFGYAIDIQQLNITKMHDFSFDYLQYY